VNENCMRIRRHPILGDAPVSRRVVIEYMGEAVQAQEGETIAAALLAAGYRKFRTTSKRGEPRGLFCAIGCCTDCIVTVDGTPNVRACTTLVADGMKISSDAGVSAGRAGKRGRDANS